MSFISLAILAVVTAIFAISFKNVKSEYGILMSVGVCFLVFIFGTGKLSTLIEAVENIKSYIGIDSTYMEIIIKIIGISYIAEFASDMCKDCGYNAMANQVQVFGKLTVLGISMPVIMALFETISNVLS